MKPYAFLLVILVPLLLVAACGGGSDDGSDPVAEFCEPEAAGCLADLLGDPENLCDVVEQSCIDRILAARVNFLEQPNTYCDQSNPDCRAAYDTQQVAIGIPTPRPEDGRIRSVILNDLVVQALVGGGEEGQTFWLDISQSSRITHGGDGGSFILLFAEGVSYEGEVLDASDPCKGEYGLDERIAEDHPCLDAERKFTTGMRTFQNTRAVRAKVNPELGLVFNMFSMELDPSYFTHVVEEYVAENTLATPTLAPSAPSP